MPLKIEYYTIIGFKSLVLNGNFYVDIFLYNYYYYYYYYYFSVSILPISETNEFANCWSH
jgi:hypothetical protein